MEDSFHAEYLKYENRRGYHARCRMLYTANPTKLIIAQYLVKYHEERGDKIIVFSDDIDVLVQFAIEIGRHYIYGKTPYKERIDILEKFKESTSKVYSTICLSKVGDNAIDLPNANVIVQINSFFASRRQEAQRLGRILRPKKQQMVNSSSAGAGQGADAFGGGLGSTEANAFFYTLVSQDTQEMYYARKRQSYLTAQGYAYKVVPDILNDQMRRVLTDGQLAELKFAPEEKRRKLLESCL